MSASVLTSRRGWTTWMALLGVWVCASEVTAQRLNESTIQLRSNGTCSLSTPLLRGEVRTETLGFGLHDLKWGDHDIPLAGRYGLMNVYRVFSDGKRYGTAAWEWPGRVRNVANGEVTIECPSADDRPFLLRGTYRVRDAVTIDLEIQIVPQQDLHDAEVFLASYCAPSFDRCQVRVRSLPATPEMAGFMSATKSLGDWLMFPRDDRGVELIRDGRWTLPPHPVAWNIMPHFDVPLAVRRCAAGGPTVVIMAHPDDCFAISMPYETEGHFSVYASLFGRDLPAGSTARARTRLKVLDAPSERELLTAFQAFLRQSSE